MNQVCDSCVNFKNIPSLVVSKQLQLRVKDLAVNMPEGPMTLEVMKRK
jgi:hypothetical protein